MNTYIFNCHQLKYVDLTVTIKNIRSNHSSYKSIVQISKHQTLTIWTVTLTNFSLPFFVNLQRLSLIWIFQHNQCFHRKNLVKMFHLPDWLSLSEADNDQSLMICITFLWLIKSFKCWSLVTDANLFALKCTPPYLWFCTTFKFSWQ